MTWFLIAWLCTSAGLCSPQPDHAYPTRGACRRAAVQAEQTEGVIAFCRLSHDGKVPHG